MRNSLSKVLRSLRKESQEVCLFGNGDLRGSGRSGGAYVCDEIGDREIGFMADGRDDRYGGFEDGFCDDLFIEGPKIFNAASSTADDQYIGEAVFVEIGDRLSD